MEEEMIDSRSRFDEHLILLGDAIDTLTHSGVIKSIDVGKDTCTFTISVPRLVFVELIKKELLWQDVGVEDIDAEGIRRVTRDPVPVASSTRNESIWYKLFRKPFKKNIKNEK